MNSVLQYVLYVGILVVVAIPLGFYMSKVMDGEKILLPASLDLLSVGSIRSCVSIRMRI